MSRNTIVPGQHPGNPDVDHAHTSRWNPVRHASREVDLPHESAYPAARRFDTIYPGTKAAEDATRAAMANARRHDRFALARFLEVLRGDGPENDS